MGLINALKLELNGLFNDIKDIFKSKCKCGADGSYCDVVKVGEWKLVVVPKEINHHGGVKLPYAYSERRLTIRCKACGYEYVNAQKFREELIINGRKIYDGF